MVQQVYQKSGSDARLVIQLVFNFGFEPKKRKVRGWVVIEGVVDFEPYICFTAMSDEELAVLNIAESRGELLRRYHGMIRSKWGEDMVSEIYIKLDKFLRLYRPIRGVSFSRWLSCLAARMVIDGKRMQSRRVTTITLNAAATKGYSEDFGMSEILAQMPPKLRDIADRRLRELPVKNWELNYLRRELEMLIASGI